MLLETEGAKRVIELVAPRRDPVPRDHQIDVEGRVGARRMHLDHAVADQNGREADAPECRTDERRVEAAWGVLRTTRADPPAGEGA